jgi:histidinol dehydrogenase
VRALAAAEGLDAHARSIDVRSKLTVPPERS